MPTSRSFGNSPRRSRAQLANSEKLTSAIKGPGHSSVTSVAAHCCAAGDAQHREIHPS